MLKNMQKWFHQKRQQTVVNRRKNEHKTVPAVEALEDRQLLTASVSLGGDGILRVTGGNNADHIRVWKYGPSTVVYDNGSAVWSTSNSHYAINGVSIDGRGGNDTLMVQNFNYYHSHPYWNSVYNKPLNSTIYGGSGNDSMYGTQWNDLLSDSSGHNYFSSGSGNDTVYGGNGRDTVYAGYGNDRVYSYGGDDIVYGSSGNDTVYADGGDDRVDGGSGNDRIYGYGGDDTLAGSNGDDYIRGDSDNDQIIGGSGKDSLYGGTGDDTIVSVDYGFSDLVYGQSGKDTLWRDFWGGSRDYVSIDSGDLVHNIMSFANGADLSLNGDSIADPSDGTNYKDFSDKVLFANAGPTAHDVDQGSIGDCWMVAAAGSIAHDNPIAVRRMVADFGDGTYGVKLGSSFYRVDADLPTLSSSPSEWRLRNAGLGREDSLWMPIVEKAYADFRRGLNTYASLNNGDPADAMRAFNANSVGQRYFAPGSSSTAIANETFNHWNAYQSTTICTGATPSGSPLVGSHCYTVFSVSRNSTGTVTSILLRNPWGEDGGARNPFITVTPAQLAAAGQIWVTWGNT